MRKTTAIILAAGLGTRMKTRVPKVLHKVGGQTILGRVIGSLRKAGVKNIVVVVGYKAEEVKKKFKKDAIFVIQKKLLGSGDAVRTALKKCTGAQGDILVTCGDAPLITAGTYKRLLKKHSGGQASCTLLTAIAADPFSYGRIIRDRSDKITGIVEEKDATPDQKCIDEVNVGTYCFNAVDLKKFISKIKPNKKKKEFYLTDIIELLVKNNKKLQSSICHMDEAIGINSRRDICLASRIINDEKLGSLIDTGVTIIDPLTTWIDESAKVGQDTVIYPNTIIEKDVIIAKSCKIGPFARLRPGVTLSDNVEVGNFVELCRTKIGAGTKVKHHTYLGDTTVGKNVNVGAGVIVANYDGRKKHKTVIRDSVFVGIGVRLVAPVKIGKGAKLGAGCVVTKNKNVMAGETVIGVPARPIKKTK